MSVIINGQELGLYTSVESINKSFLSKHFGNSNGSFFKCEPQFLLDKNMMLGRTLHGTVRILLPMTTKWDMN